MDLAKKLIDLIMNFDVWDIGGSKTQISGRQSEDYVEDCFKKIFDEKIKIYKMGSQQHPDFIMAPSEVVPDILRFNEKITKNSKITLNVLNKWEKSEYNLKNLKLLRVEVKTGKSNYTLNDTFPEPSNEFDEIYILFSIGEKKVFVTTSSTMAKSHDVIPSIGERYKKSKIAISNFHSTLKEIWKNTGISTAARPTYRMNKDYSHVLAKVETISKLLTSAGLTRESK